MSDQKSPLASSLPLILIAAVAGGALSFCHENQLLPHAKTLAIALGFGLLAALVGVLSRAQAAVVDQNKGVTDTQSGLAKQIAAAIEGSQAGIAAEMQKSQKEIAAFAAQLNTANQVSQKTFADFGATLKQVMGEQATKLGGIGASFHEQAISAFTSHRNMLQTALDEVQKNSEAWRARFDSSINAHASSIDKSSRTLAESLEKIALIGRDLDKLLQVQKTIDTTLENMAKTEDFKKTISRLAEHLQNAEQVIKAATKPRAIRLVESEAD